MTLQGEIVREAPPKKLLSVALQPLHATAKYLFPKLQTYWAASAISRALSAKATKSSRWNFRIKSCTFLWCVTGTKESNASVFHCCSLLRQALATSWSPCPGNQSPSQQTLVAVNVTPPTPRAYHAISCFLACQHQHNKRNKICCTYQVTRLSTFLPVLSKK